MVVSGFLEKIGESGQAAVVPQGVSGPVLGFGGERLHLAVCLCGDFPVLVLRGLSVSLWAVASGVAVLWLVQPMLLLGLGTAFAGLVPAAGPLYTMIGKAAEFLTGLLNRWAVWVSAKPGAGLYFDTNYAALVCLLLMALCGLAHLWKVRLRVAVPGLLLTAVLAIGVGNALCGMWCTSTLWAVPTARRWWSARITQPWCCSGVGHPLSGRLENQLARRGVTTVELLADLRLDPENACTLPAGRVPSGSAAGGKRRHPTDVDRSSGDPAYPVRLPCAADHRGAAVRDRERNGDAGRTGPGAVAAGISGKAGGRAVGTAAEPE